MQITVLLFAAAREAAKHDSIQIEIPDNACALDVMAELGKQIPAIEPLIPSCRLAIDSCYVGNDAIVATGQEIALIPPVSGG